MKQHILSILIGITLIALLAGCGSAAGSAAVSEEAPSASFGVSAEEAASVEPEDSSLTQPEEASAEAAGPEQSSDAEPAEAAEEASAEEASAEEASSDYTPIITEANVTSDGIIDATELFTERDLTQNADLSGATEYTVSDGEDIHITAEGVYVLTGSASNVTVYVEADDQAKVQLVLDGVDITNDDFPCIYVTEADKVFVTTASDSSLAVTGTFTADGETNTDGVIFCRSDLVLSGTATLTISSTDNGIVGKDDLKITGGTYVISAGSKDIEANDSIRIADGTFTLTAGTDALHAENDEDDTQGYIYICGGSFSIDVDDDAIHATSVVQIDGGDFTISGAEGIEGTYIQINGGTIYIDSWDDGINAAYKSSAYYPTVEINGGDITVVMASGDTDGIDSNGDVIVNGGTVDVTGRSTFDYDGTGEFNGGTIIVNGQETDSLPNQMGGGRGGW